MFPAWKTVTIPSFSEKVYEIHRENVVYMNAESNGK
jgi:hypothetical protein